MAISQSGTLTLRKVAHWWRQYKFAFWNMIEGIIRLKSIGQFDDVNPPENTRFKRFTLLYAANGRGKTTLACILRSLANNDPTLLVERSRLGAQDSPSIILNHAGRQFTFQEGEWIQNLSNIAIFDDAFVAANVCSGIEVRQEHQKNLHEIIIGDQGVRLNGELKSLINQIEQFSSRLRDLSNTITSDVRGPYNVDAFCDLQQDPEVDAKIEKAQNRLAATKSAEKIHHQSGFQEISLPDINTEVINDVLTRNLENLEADATRQVNDHLNRLGGGSEAWVADGMPRIHPASEGLGHEVCPFCAQSLDGSFLIEHYKAYFSEAYKQLNASIRQTSVEFQSAHTGDIRVAFERNIHTLRQTHEFWIKFIDLPLLEIDAATIVQEWRVARDAVLNKLQEKAAAPLEEMVLSARARQAIDTYQGRVAEVDRLSTILTNFNDRLDRIRQQAADDNPEVLADNLGGLQAQRTRFDDAVRAQCDNYLVERAAKAGAERQRNQVRRQLERYRREIFPTYQNAINHYLNRFDASFRLGDVRPVNNRYGSSVSFCVVINQNSVSLNADEGPSFRNTLSAGDRGTLALAFFFASLDLDNNRANKIVVFDDPITSLDEHRALQTRTEIGNLAAQVQQVIVLSHSKSFLCSLWEQADRRTSAALQINRAESGSEIIAWDVRNDSISEHDKRHKLVREYVAAANPGQEREVAQSLRPMLEAFLRVAYPEHFPPKTVIGRFLNKCREQLGADSEILSGEDYNELNELKDFSNRFHHDGDPAWQNEIINERELTRYAKRVLRFTSRKPMQRADNMAP